MPNAERCFEFTESGRGNDPAGKRKRTGGGKPPVRDLQCRYRHLWKSSSFGLLSVIGRKTACEAEMIYMIPTWVPTGVQSPPELTPQVKTTRPLDETA